MSNRLFWQQVLGLALPVAFQSALVAALGMADVLMVSHLGSEAVAAVGLSAKLNFVLILVMAALGTGCSILVAQYFGAGRHDKVQQTLAMSLLAGGAVMLPFTILILAWPGALIRLGTADPAVIGLGTGYLVWLGLTLFTTQAIMIYEAAMRSIGRTRWPLRYAVAAILMNIVLNYWFINGGIGLPAMGVAGAAIATVLARLFQIGWMVRDVQRDPALRLTAGAFRALRASRLPRRFLSLTWPLVLNFTLWSVGSLGYHLIAGHLGTVPLAVVSLLAPIEMLYHSLFFGVVSAAGIMIGQRLGRGLFGEAEWLAGRLMWMAPLGSFLLGLVLLAASPLLLAAMRIDDLQTIHLAQWVMVVMCLGFWVKVFNMTAIQGILRAGGDSRFCLGMDMFAMWMVGLPLTWLAAFVWELPFALVYAMVLTEEVTKAIGVYWRVHRRHWVVNLAAADEPLPSPQAA
ncbi:MAG: MATE family efflux transporter [Pseudomonadota bacterium]|nr:MATE family efflux transporter [Pseudomonadota bacterium]